MSKIYFVSSNVHKYEEIRQILDKYGIQLKFRSTNLPELQSDSLDYIALEKAQFAFKNIAKPVLIEDDGLFISTLSGFPGPYSSYVFNTIGNAGILRLISNYKDRSATFISILVYINGDVTKRFIGKTKGKISLKAKGAGWGYDPIFIPSSSKQSFGQLGEGKTSISHRALAAISFAKWYCRNKSNKAQST